VRQASGFSLQVLVAGVTYQFGGCAVALVKMDSVEAVSRKIAADYKAKTGIEATIFVSRPAAGATIIKA
jgi:galactokinase